MPAPFIYINSWPGVGKHTIAKEIIKLLGERARIIHNHQHIDLAGAVLPRSSPHYQDLRFSLRQVLFDSLAKAEDTFEFAYIFTDVQADNDLGHKVVGQFASGARSRGCVFIPVVLDCDLKVNVERIRSEERLQLVAHGKGMLTDLGVLDEMRAKWEILKYDCPESLELDITHLQPKDAAKRIVKHLGSFWKPDKEIDWCKSD
ncbi:hypothetical protein B0J14DRAFT_652928 [Halenospora varia]|nr:hypothetical protein B0J14DRAFT_652928 [Halenospora varia]